MDGLDLLWAVYDWYPVAFLADFVMLQVALRWSYWRSNSPSRS